MTKELFALYLVFSTPTGVEERFAMTRENCKNLQPIVEQEFKRLNINRDEHRQTGHMCIGWEYHLIRQKLQGKDVPPPQPKYRPCSVPIERSE
jgi:hypothetical protein